MTPIRVVPTMSSHPETTIDEEVEQRQQPARQPRYQVILWNDDDHTFDYVINMLKKLFGHPRPLGMQIARTVDKQGKAVCLTTTLEHAELKRDQIRAFGRDQLIAHCQGSMSATIQPVPE